MFSFVQRITINFVLKYKEETMRSVSRLIVTFGFMLMPVLAQPAVPSIMNFQGLILDAADNPVPDSPPNHTIVFSIYADLSGGTPLWTETHSVETNGGYAEVALGIFTPITEDLFDGTVQYLGVKYESDNEMSPRFALGTVPYSFLLGTIDGASGGTVTGDVLLGNISNNWGVGGNLWVENSFGDVNNTFRIDGWMDTLYIVANSGTGSSAGTNIVFRTETSGWGEQDRMCIDQEGRVGIGTTSPRGKLQVVGDDIFVGPVTHLFPDPPTDAIYFQNNGGESENHFRIDAEQNYLRLMATSGFQTLTGAGIQFYTSPETGGGRSDKTGISSHDEPAYERMRIEPGGAIVIGDGGTVPIVSIPDSRVYISGGMGTGPHFHVAKGSFSGMAVNQNTVAAFEDHFDSYVSILAPSDKERGIIFADEINPNDGGIFYTGASNRIEFRTNGNITRMLIDQNGRIGVGNTSLGERFNVDGNGWASGTWLSFSDARYKEEVQPIGTALARALQLRGVTYRWKQNEFPEQKFDDQTHIGFLAQELEQVIPEVVITDANGYKSVDYGRLTPLLVEAIKEQQQRIDKLEKKLEELMPLVGQK